MGPPFVALALILAPAFAQQADIPKTFTAPTADFDYTEREVMIPMRDGVMLLHMLSRLGQEDDVFVAGGYIRVMQDIRGRYGSEGDYWMTRPIRGPLDSTSVDHATDTYDTIDWLVQNLPESNGRVGMTGCSYGGFTVVMGLIDPHPALKVAAPACDDGCPTPMKTLYLQASKLEAISDASAEGRWLQGGTSATTHETPMVRIDDLNDPYWTRILVAMRRVK